MRDFDIELHRHLRDERCLKTFLRCVDFEGAQLPPVSGLDGELVWRRTRPP